MSLISIEHLPTECDIHLKSWGYSETDETGHIIVNDVTLISTVLPDRGMALKVIDPVTCQTLTGGSWDIWAGTSQAHAMRDFLLALPNGTLVLGITMDDVVG